MGIAKKHGIDTIAVAMYFVLAADEFVAIILGASKIEQVEDNVRAWKSEIPRDFWNELEAEDLIYEKAKTNTWPYYSPSKLRYRVSIT